MHPIQEKLIALLKDQGSTPLKYREIWRKIGEAYPQTVKYHIEVLQKNNLIMEQNNFLKLTTTSSIDGGFFNLPYFWLAKCGEATVFTDDLADGFIKISKNALPIKTVADFFLVRATGNSMDKASIGINKRNIDDGDLVVVDFTQKNPSNWDYIVSVIDWCANIKRFKNDSTYNQIALVSESSDNYFPIIIHETDNFNVVGKVIEVIKTNL